MSDKEIEQLAEKFAKDEGYNKYNDFHIKTGFIAGYKAALQYIHKEENEAETVPLSEHLKAIDYIGALEKQLADAESYIERFK